MNRFGGAMKTVPASVAAAIVCVVLPIIPATAAESPPRWAYPENNRNYKPPADDGNLVRVPDSAAGYTWTQLRDRFSAPVWHPGDHGPCVDGSELARRIFTSQAWVDAAMCSAFESGSHDRWP
jgi:hypothetical protein